MAARSILSAPVVVAVANTGEVDPAWSELFQVDKDAARVSSARWRSKARRGGRKSARGRHLAGHRLGVLGILFLMKQDVLSFLGEPAGEFMAVVPLGYPAKTTEGTEETAPRRTRPASGLMPRFGVL